MRKLVAEIFGRFPECLDTASLEWYSTEDVNFHLGFVRLTGITWVVQQKSEKRLLIVGRGLDVDVGLFVGGGWYIFSISPEIRYGYWRKRRSTPFRLVNKSVFVEMFVERRPFVWSWWIEDDPHLSRFVSIRDTMMRQIPNGTIGEGAVMVYLFCVTESDIHWALIEHLRLSFGKCCITSETLNQCTIMTKDISVIRNVDGRIPKHETSFVPFSSVTRCSF